MRITNSMIISNYIRNLNNNGNSISRLHSQISSGKRLLRASDDPLAARRIMNFKTDLARTAQYTSNVTQAKQWIVQTETSLNELNSLLTRVKELNLQANNATKGADERAAIANEISQIMEQVVENANTMFVGRYVFGGINTHEKPFKVEEVDGQKVLFYNDHNLSELDKPENAAIYEDLKSQKVNYTLAFNSSMDVSYNGIDIMGVGEDNLYSVLNNLRIALETQDADGISNSLDKVDAHKSNIISYLGEIGGKTNRLEAFENRLSNDKYNYEQMLTEVEGIDIYEVILNLQNEEVIYQAALSAGSRLITRTLADFL